MGSPKAAKFFEYKYTYYPKLIISLQPVFISQYTSKLSSNNRTGVAKYVANK